MQVEQKFTVGDIVLQKKGNETFLGFDLYYREEGDGCDEATTTYYLVKGKEVKAIIESKCSAGMGQGQGYIDEHEITFKEIL